jgi:hypothetical protein
VGSIEATDLAADNKKRFVITIQKSKRQDGNFGINE